MNKAVEKINATYKTLRITGGVEKQTTHNNLSQKEMVQIYDKKKLNYCLK